MLAKLRRGARIAPRDVPDAEVVRLTLAVLANAGARLIDAGVARRAGDIDALAIAAQGFPRHRGGPMKAAEHAGLLGLVRVLETREGAAYYPSAALRRAVLNGNRFAD
ncbi:MAG: hypothetical protein ACU0CO_17285 [Shimia sp.]